MGVLSDTTAKFVIGKELLAFLWRRKKLWMIPMVSVLLLLSIALIAGNTSGVTPFIYTFF